jgi:hypothetical protein
MPFELNGRHNRITLAFWLLPSISGEPAANARRSASPLAVAGRKGFFFLSQSWIHFSGFNLKKYRIVIINRDSF